MKRTPWEQEFREVWRQEQWFMRKYAAKTPNAVERKVSELAPRALERSLHSAFIKAFEAVFEKGDGLIRTLGQQEKRRETCRENTAAVSCREERSSLRAFRRCAVRSGRGNVVLSGAAGVGMGALGVALPDVPVLTGMLLKSVYETAESFGFHCDDDAERLYALRVIEAALSYGEELRSLGRALDLYAQTGVWSDARPLRDQLERTARKLSETVLYGKVLQGVPVAGVVGGMGDAMCMSRVRNYAAIKYYKRFLIGRRTKEF